MDFGAIWVMETIKAVWAFISLWGSRVSGAIAIPFFWYGAAHGLTNGAAYVYTAFFALGVCALGQGAKILQLERRFRPTLRLACSPDVAGCWSIAPDGGHVAYRLRVVNEGLQEIVRCEARLISITYGDEVRLSGEVAVLTFAPAEGMDAEDKTLRSRVPYWLDIIFITQDREIKMGTKRSYWRFDPPDVIFRDRGRYCLRVEFTAMKRSMPPVRATLAFDWKGNYVDSGMILVDTDPKEARDTKP